MILPLELCVLAAILAYLMYIYFVPSAIRWAAAATQAKQHRNILRVRDIEKISSKHEVAAALCKLIQSDGAGSWPPATNHEHENWPMALKPYREIYLELAPYLPQVTPSLDDEVNRMRISSFRGLFDDFLRTRVNIDDVAKLLQSVDAGKWHLISREAYNAFYCCIASSRHAYRWATIPVVRCAQLEKEVCLPRELTEPWLFLQRHFGCPSDSGNNTSNLVLNFDSRGRHVYKINTGMSPRILASEEAFARIFHDIEVLGLTVYHDMALAAMAFSQGHLGSCARHVADITAQVRLVFSVYFDNLHNDRVAVRLWLSRVQGFFAWGSGRRDETMDEWETFDGLSGNQVLLFQALDAFLGIDQYLSTRDQVRNVPTLQRALCSALAKHSFRNQVIGMAPSELRDSIVMSFEKIIKQLRVFRHTHRARSKVYLSQPAIERLPMTAGKSLLAPTIEESLEFLDEFMIRRISQTI